MEVSRRLVHCPLHSETQSHQREGRELEGGLEFIMSKYYITVNIPCTVSCDEALDGLLLATVHL